MKARAIVLLMGDVGVLYGSLFLTLTLRHRLVPFDDYWAHHVIPFTMIFVIWIAVFYFHDLYSRESIRINTKFFASVIQAMFFNGLLAVSFFYFSGAFDITPKTNLLLFSIFFFFLFVAWRSLSANIIRGQSNYRRIAFAGLSLEEEELIKETIEDSYYPMKLVEFGNFEFDVLLAGKHSFENDKTRLYASVVRGREVMDIVTFLEGVTGRVPIEHASTDWFINKFDLVKDREYAIIKRAFDVVLSIVLMIIFFVPMLFIAAAVKFGSKGPVLYRQIRTGEHGVQYVLSKFRSMTEDAEADGPQWSTKNDMRVTRIGKILRHTHLDELPQLWNILVGEMSFVGPRPERPEIIEVLNEEISFYSLRHLVKPGVTGWAQINYSYGASIEDSKNKLAYDLYYIKHRAFLWDIRIIVKTLATMVRGEGR